MVMRLYGRSSGRGSLSGLIAPGTRLGACGWLPVSKSMLRVLTTASLPRLPVPMLLTSPVLMVMLRNLLVMSTSPPVRWRVTVTPALCVSGICMSGAHEPADDDEAAAAGAGGNRVDTAGVAPDSATASTAGVGLAVPCGCDSASDSLTASAAASNAASARRNAIMLPRRYVECDAATAATTAADETWNAFNQAVVPTKAQQVNASAASATNA